MEVPAAGTRDRTELASRAAWGLFLACVAAVPLVTTTPFVGGTGAPFLLHDPDIAKFLVAVVLVPASILAWAVSLSQGARVRIHALYWLLFGALVWIGLATIAAPDPALALLGDGVRYEGFVAYLLYGAVFFLGVQLVDSSARVRRVAETLAVAGALSGLHGLLQFLGVDPFNNVGLGFEANRAFGTLGNPDYFGLWQVLVLPISISLAVTTRGRWAARAWWLASISTSLGLLLAFSRGGWIGGVVALVLVSVAAARSGWRPSRSDGAMVAGGVVLMVAVSLVSLGTSSTVTSVFSRIASFVDMSDGSTLSRLATWRSALAAIGDRPLFGFGPDSFALAFGAHRVDAYTRVAGAYRFENNAHNLPLQLAATLGLIGAVLILGVMVAVLWRSWSDTVGAARGENRVVLAGVWAGCAASLVSLLFGVSVVGVALPMWALLGVLLSPSAASHRIVGRSAVVARVVAAVVMVAAIGTAWSLGTADALAQRSTLLFNSAASVDYAAKAAERAPYSTGYRLQLGIARSAEMAALLAANGGVSDARIEQAYVTARLDLERIAMKRRCDLEAWMALADTDLRYAYSQGDEASFRIAESTANRAIGFLPQEPLLRLVLGTAQLELGDSDAAARAAQGVLRLDPTYEPALGLLRAAEARQ